MTCSLNLCFSRTRSHRLQPEPFIWLRRRDVAFASDRKGADSRYSGRFHPSAHDVNPSAHSAKRRRTQTQLCHAAVYWNHGGLCPRLRIVTSHPRTDDSAHARTSPPPPLRLRARSSPSATPLPPPLRRYCVHVVSVVVTQRTYYSDARGVLLRRRVLIRHKQHALSCPRTEPNDDALARTVGGFRS